MHHIAVRADDVRRPEESSAHRGKQHETVLGIGGSTRKAMRKIERPGDAADPAELPKEQHEFQAQRGRPLQRRIARYVRQAAEPAPALLDQIRQ